MHFNIKARMIAAFLTIIIGPITILGVLSYDKTETILVNKAKEHSLRTMQNARTFFIEQYIAQMEGAIETMAGNPELRQLAGTPAGQALDEWEQYRRLNPGVAAVYFATPQGQTFLAAPGKLPPAFDPRKRPWYKKAVDARGRVVWSDVYPDNLANRSIITASKAVIDGDTLYGVFGMDTSLSVLSDIIRKITFEQGGYAILIDKNGQIVAHPDADKLGSHVADENWYWELKYKYEGSLPISLDGRETMVGFITIPQTDWKLIGFIPQENIDRELAPIRNHTLGVGLIAAILAMTIGIMIANDIGGRLQGLVAAMTAVEKGDFRARWHDHSPGEFGALSNKFNTMVTTLENLIYQQQASQHQIALQKVYFEQLFENSPESIAIIDPNDRVVKVNPRFTAMFGYTAEEAEGEYINDLVVPAELQDEGIHASTAVIRDNRVMELETQRRRKDGSLLSVFVLAYPIIVMGKLAGGYAVYRDISERKEVERKLTYASTHDLLTGVFNRGYFEQEMARVEEAGCLSTGIIVADIDGLKLMNDTLGHAVGDDMLVLAASILQVSLPDGAMLCRIGGDEFAMLVPATDEAALQAICEQIKAAVAAASRTNREFALSMSVGYGVKYTASTSMSEVYREADSSMYREKLHRSNSTRSALVKTLTEALHARDFITEGHADRLQELVEKLARAVGVSERRIGDLRLLAQFHDVGKVGIPDNILFKPERLTDNEMRVMRRHSEIGYRIAVASPDFHHIADWILKHHEWWDGGGYPLGLKGEEIPLECRILLIADAYDAMTQDRPYRNAMSPEAALAEIAACRGVMFDPVLADKFIALMQATPA